MTYRAIFVVFVLALSLSIWAKEKPKMEDVAGKLACYCGTCPHLVVTRCGCSTADQIKVDVQKMIDSGQSEDQIIQTYVAKYGQTVLAAPTKSGFNLTAWAIPFVAFFIGGAVLITYLKKQRSSRDTDNTQNTESTPVDATETYYRDILNKELEERK